MIRLERLRQLHPVMLDGEPWWKYRDVAWALRITGLSGIPACVPASSRRIMREYRSRYNSCRRAWLNRAGVEALVMRYGGTIPRSTYMAALELGAGLQGNEHGKARMGEAGGMVLLSHDLQTR